MTLTFDERVDRLTRAGIPRRAVAAILDVTDADVATQSAAPDTVDPPTAQQLAVADSGVLLPQRGVLDFEGAGVALADDEPGDRTVVTVAGGGGGGGGGGASVVALDDFTNTQDGELTGLAGDTNRRLRIAIDGHIATTGDVDFGLRCNGDSNAAHYGGNFRFDYSGETAPTWNTSTQPFLLIGRTGYSTGGRVYSVVELACVSGVARVASFEAVMALDDGNRIMQRGIAVWTNTADELDTLGLILPGSATFTGQIAALAL